MRRGLVYYCPRAEWPPVGWGVAYILPAQDIRVCLPMPFHLPVRFALKVWWRFARPSYSEREALEGRARHAERQLEAIRRAYALVCMEAEAADGRARGYALAAHDALQAATALNAQLETLRAELLGPGPEPPPGPDGCPPGERFEDPDPRGRW